MSWKPGSRRGLVFLPGSGPPAGGTPGASRWALAACCRTAATLEEAYLEARSPTLDQVWLERAKEAVRRLRALAPGPVGAALELVRRGEGVGHGPARAEGTLMALAARAPAGHPADAVLGRSHFLAGSAEALHTLAASVQLLSQVPASVRPCLPAPGRALGYNTLGLLRP